MTRLAASFCLRRGVVTQVTALPSKEHVQGIKQPLALSLGSKPSLYHLPTPRAAANVSFITVTETFEFQGH